MIPGSANPLLLASAAAAGGYQVSRSLRFNSSDSASCARTFSSGSSTTTQTLSLWVKRAKLGATGCFWSGYDGSATYGAYFQFESSDALTVILGGASLYQLTTTQVFRDPSSWYHIVLTIDTNNGTSGDRIRLYVNGSRVTTFSTASYPTSGYGCQFALGNANNKIGTTWGSSGYSYFDGYLADIHFIDGQALTPSSFTEVSATTGQLIPLAYSGTFGTNGFQLKFADNSSNTAATLGKDTSGNSNNWTPNNLSVTAGAGNDSLVDTPTSISATDTGVGGEIRGNYCTWNPLASASTSTLSNGNLDAMTGTTFPGTVSATFGMSTGKWYWEITFSGSNYGPYIGIKSTAEATTSYPGQAATSYSWYSEGSSYSKKINNSISVDYSLGVGFTLGDIIGVAFDADAGSLEFYKNGTSQGVAFTSISAGTYVAAVGDGTNAGGPTLIGNFGQRAFAYQTPGTNRPAATFLALCDTNLPAPLTAKPNTLMDVALYTGNGGTQTISGLAFEPDFVWLKGRSVAYSHQLYDQVRGAGKLLNSNSTSGESTVTDNLTAFTSAGFTLGNDAGTNQSSATYVGWAWDAGTSTVSNTAGSITSQVRANASAGFSIVSWTATGSVSTVGHGLNAKPSLCIHKPRTGSYDWAVITDILNGSLQYLYLNSTQAVISTGWGSSPTSSVMSAYSYSAGQTMISYCFAPVVGYSSFGSYTGNGSTDGPFVYTGFRPRWVMIKASSASGEWGISDAARDQYNVVSNVLLAESSGADNTGFVLLDFTSNGFKLRNSNANRNANGTTYIYIAFAENPFQYARAR